MSAPHTIKNDDFFLTSSLRAADFYTNGRVVFLTIGFPPFSDNDGIVSSIWTSVEATI